MGARAPVEPDFGGVGRGIDAYLAAELNLLARAAPGRLSAAIGSGPFVSVGVGVSRAAPFLARARGRGLPVVRRHTGGTALLHLPGDLLWCVVLPRTDPRIARGFVHAYELLGAPVVEFLRGLGVASSWEEPPGLSEEYCTLGRRGRVLKVGDRVVGGAAQHATGAAVLHHGTISWGTDRPLAVELFGTELGSAFELLDGIGPKVPGSTPLELTDRLDAALDRFVATGRAIGPSD